MPRKLLTTLIILLFLTTQIITAQEATEEPESTPDPVPEATVEPESTPDPVPEATEEPEEEQPESSEGSATYVVKAGDTLFRIAINNGTTYTELARINGIANPRLIYTGQILKLPGAAQAPQPVETPVPAETPEPVETPEPDTGGTYTIKPGDTLYRIAVNNNTTTAALMALNNISNANIIFAGRTLKLPGATATLPESGEDTTTETMPVINPNFAYGIEVFVAADNAASISSMASQLGVSWVKIRVNWSSVEPTEGTFDLTALDNAIEQFHADGFSTLLTVTAAPNWARSSIEADQLNRGFGPPDDFELYGEFVGFLAERYQGKVKAYEIWNQPNLRREWYSTEHPMSVGEYVDLVEIAYGKIKAIDPNAAVITAGLAPTSLHDGFNALDDRIFLRDMLASGVADFSDGIGVNPAGWGNPPSATCCDQPTGVDTHFESPHFYFLETLNAYSEIIEKANVQSSLWVTDFGWGSNQGTVLQLPDNIRENPSRASNYVYLQYNSEAEQALYIEQAFEKGKELGVGPMILSNLNACQFGDWENCFLSLIGSDGTPRPAFATVQAIDKTSGE